MRQTDKIDNLIKQLNTTASDKLDQRIDALIEPKMPTDGQPLDIRSTFMKNPMFKYAAAAVIIVGVLTGIYQLTGSIDGASVAWADVLQQVYETHSVTYQCVIKTEKISVESTKMQMEPGLVRTETAKTGNITICDHASGTKIFLMPKTKRALIQYTVNQKTPNSNTNHYAWLKHLHLEEAKFVGEEIVEGFKYNVYVSQFPFSQTTAWVHPKTNLPEKIIFEAFKNTDINFAIPEIRLSVRDFGGKIETYTGKDEKKYARSGLATKITAGNSSRRGGLGIQDEMTIIYQDFNWNADLDKSLFSMVPPQDYAVSEKTIDYSKQIHSEEALVYAFNFWLRMSNNKFPESIDCLGDPVLIKPMIIKAFDHDDDPEQEWKAACDETRKIFKGFSFVLEKKIECDWGYCGQNASLGEAHKIIYWWFDNEQKSYRAIFGDLRIETVSKKQLPTQS